MIRANKGEVLMEGKTVDLYLEVASILRALQEGDGFQIPAKSLSMLVDATGKPDDEMQAMVLGAIMYGCMNSSNDEPEESPENVGEAFFGERRH